MMTESTHTGGHDRLDGHDRLESQSVTVLDGHDYTLSVDEAAAILGKSVETVRRYARSGRLPSMRVQGDRIIEYRFRPDDLQGGHAVIGGQAGSQSVMRAKANGYTDDRLMTASTMERVLAPLLVSVRDALQANERLTRQLTELAAEKGELAGQLAGKDALIVELRRQLAAQVTATAPPNSPELEKPVGQPTPPRRPRSLLGQLAARVAARLG